MKKSLLYISCYLLMLMISNACQAKKLADCIQTGDCDKYESPTESDGTNLRTAEVDSLISNIELESEIETNLTKTVSHGR